MVRRRKGVTSRRKAERLLRVLEQIRGGRLAIFLQTNPDPDAIACGLGLQKLGEHVGVTSALYYGGRIGHHQTRAMVNLLEIQLERMEGPDVASKIMADAAGTALVDAAVAARYNILPRDVKPTIVIDHHEVEGKAPGDFVDIRPEVGATCSLVSGYLADLGIEMETGLATALLYGIRADTHQYLRNFSEEDLRAVNFLTPLADLALVEAIEHPPMSKETVDVLGRAIRNREPRGSYVVSSAEFISDRDALPQAAEMLIKEEGVETALVFGISESQVIFSARTRDPRVNLASVLAEAFGAESTGGHHAMAGGTIGLGFFQGTQSRAELLALTTEAVKRRFFDAVGAIESDQFED